MKFTFDEEGHIVWTPKELYLMVLENPLRVHRLENNDPLGRPEPASSLPRPRIG